MLVPVLLCLSSVASVAVCDGQSVLAAKYSYSLVLSSLNYELYWSFDPANENVSIAVRVKTLGWVGLGVSEKGGMENADIVTGRVMNGNAELTDRFAAMQGYPSSDTEQNWFLIGGSESDGWTTLEFWRYLDTGDTASDRVIAKTFNPVIYAWGTTDTVEYHMTRRGSQAVNFVQGDQGPPLPSEAKTFQLRVNNVTIPEKDTTYWCEGFTLPEEIRKEKKHVIKISALIHEPARAHVHHLVLYDCDGSGVESLTNEQLRGSECVFVGNPDPKQQCLAGRIVAAWAVGGTDFYYPEDVSFSIGGPDSSPYWLIEMHYDNPSEVSGVVDNSGLEFTYFDDPRRFDAGVLQVGHSVRYTMVIPPRQEQFNVFGVCDSSCTQNFPAEGITVFANVLHTHLAGQGITLRHYRNGVEVTPAIDQDLNYDFDYQQYRSVTPRKVLRGDVLELECNYRSTDRNVTVYGGLGTFQEMCLSFLVYYPRVHITDCLSTITEESLATDLRLAEVAAALNLTSVQQAFQAIYTQYFPWDATKVTALSNRYKNTRNDVATQYKCNIIPGSIPPTLPPDSKCAIRSTAFSVDQNCSGGINVSELLTSAATNVPITSQLYSNACSSQSCFNTYIKTYRVCLIDVSGARGNSTGIKSVNQEVYQSIVPMARKVFCAKKDGEFCSTLFPEILSDNFTSILSPCATAVSSANCSDCCNAVINAAKKYGCCLQSYLSLSPQPGPCLGKRIWKRCGVPNPGKCTVCLRDPRKRPRN